VIVAKSGTYLSVVSAKLALAESPFTLAASNNNTNTVVQYGIYARKDIPLLKDDLPRPTLLHTAQLIIHRRNSSQSEINSHALAFVAKVMYSILDRLDAKP
jgi:hypothetical protein